MSTKKNPKQSPTLIKDLTQEPIPVRESLIDKVAAIKRNEKFQQELRQILPSKDTPENIQEKLDALAKRWGVPFLEYDRRFPDVAIFAKPRAVQVVTEGGIPLIIDQKYKHQQDCALAIVVKKKGKPQEKLGVYLDYSAIAEGGRYLTLKIDLWERRDILKKEFDKILDGKLKGGRRERPTAGVNNPWLVYDLKKQDKTYRQIVEKLNPTKDENLLFSYKETARKTYARARKMIEGVTPQ